MARPKGRRRRGNGEGTVYQRADGRWCGQATVGLDIRGEPQRVTVYDWTQAGCVEALRKKRREAEAEARGQAPSDGMTVAEGVRLWLGGLKDTLEASSYEKYERDVAPAAKALGPRPLADVTPVELTRVFAALAAEGMSASKRGRVLGRLRGMWRAMVALGAAVGNPAEAVPKPKRQRPKPRPLSREQMAVLFKEAAGHRLEPLVWGALDSGARLGELLALDVADLQGRDLVVEKTLTQRGKLKATKTPTSRRRITLTPQTAAMLAALAGRPPREPLFAAPAGGRYSHSSVADHWLPLKQRAGLRCRFHDLRHTCATMLLLANVHPKVVSERLGHSSIQITLDTYSHLLPTMQSTAAEALERLLPAVAVK